MARRELNRAEARAALGEMPERTFARWVAKGMPRRGDGEAARYPWPEIYRWLLEQARREAKQAATKPSTVEAARRQFEGARASIEDLKLEQLRASLMTAEQYAQALESAFGRVRARALTLPTKTAPLMVGLLTVQDALAVLQPAVAELLDELHAADDVPLPPHDPEEVEVA